MNINLDLLMQDSRLTGCLYDIASYCTSYKQWLLDNLDSGVAFIFSPLTGENEEIEGWKMSDLRDTDSVTLGLLRNLSTEITTDELGDDDFFLVLLMPDKDDPDNPDICTVLVYIVEVERTQK